MMTGAVFSIPSICRPRSGSHFMRGGSTRWRWTRPSTTSPLRTSPRTGPKSRRRVSAFPARCRVKSRTNGSCAMWTSRSPHSCTEWSRCGKSSRACSCRHRGGFHRDMTSTRCAISSARCRPAFRGQWNSATRRGICRGSCICSSITTSRGRGTISRRSRRRMPRRSVFSRRRRTSPSCGSWAIRRRNIFPTDRAGIITRSARGCARSRWKTGR